MVSFLALHTQEEFTEIHSNPFVAACHFHFGLVFNVSSTSDDCLRPCWILFIRLTTGCLHIGIDFDFLSFVYSNILHY